MNQFEIKQFLKEHQGTFYTAKDIAQLTKSNEIGIFSKLNEISKDADIIIKNIFTGPLNKPTASYCFASQDEDLNNTLLEFNNARQRKDLNGIYHPELIAQLLLIKEIKKLNKRLQDGSKQ